MSETIGTCEICGATDHHLVEGLCPDCQPKTITIFAGGRQCGKTFVRRNIESVVRCGDLGEEAFGVSADLTHLPEDEAEFGVEADVRHVLGAAP